MEDKVLCDKSDLVNIADSVRSKLGVTDTYYVSELSSAIQNIQTGGGGSSVGVQSNWLENDSSSLAYVQNRTHYDSRTFEILLEADSIEPATIGFLMQRGSMDLTQIAAGDNAEVTMLISVSENETKYDQMDGVVSPEGVKDISNGFHLPAGSLYGFAVIDTMGNLIAACYYVPTQEAADLFVQHGLQAEVGLYGYFPNDSITLLSLSIRMRRYNNDGFIKTIDKKYLPMDAIVNGVLSSISAAEGVSV